MQNRRTGPPAVAGNGSSSPTPEQGSNGPSAPIRVAIADSVSQAALAGMLGVLNGALPLKHARAAHALGELAIRGVVTAQEYETRQGFDLPGLPVSPASGEVLDETPGTAREV